MGRHITTGRSVGGWWGEVGWGGVVGGWWLVVGGWWLVVGGEHVGGEHVFGK